VYLHPNTSRAQRVTHGVVEHPTQEDLHVAMEHRLLQEQQEIHVDNYGVFGQDRVGMQRYEKKVANGTAWAHLDGGLSLKDQRRMKIRLGWIPKGNVGLYRQRGDVDMPGPKFRAAAQTSVDALLYPREDNLSQASRGAMVLGRRAEMDIADMHDQGETEGETSVLVRQYTRMSGNAIDVGDMKSQLGLKRNRKSVPKFSKGTATMGVPNDEGTAGSFGNHF
jgi:hypothetical protein